MKVQRFRGRRGAVLIEYGFLLLVFGIPFAVGLMAGGVSMLANYYTARGHILNPVP